MQKNNRTPKVSCELLFLRKKMCELRLTHFVFQSFLRNRFFLFSPRVVSSAYCREHHSPPPLLFTEPQTIQNRVDGIDIVFTLSVTPCSRIRPSDKDTNIFRRMPDVLSARINGEERVIPISFILKIFGCEIFIRLCSRVLFLFAFPFLFYHFSRVRTHSKRWVVLLCFFPFGTP